MNRFTALTFAVLTSLAVIPAAHAENPGQELVQANCKSCHDASVYTRENRRVKSLDGLQKQVRRCEQSLGLTWFDEDVDQVVNYLNVNYYKF